MGGWLLDLSGFWQGTGGVIISGLVAYGIARWGHNRGQAAERRRLEHQEQMRAAIELQEAAGTLRAALVAARAALSSSRTSDDGLIQAATAVEAFRHVVNREAPWFSYEAFNRPWWFGRPPRGVERTLVSEEAEGLLNVSLAMFSRIRSGAKYDGWSEDDFQTALKGELPMADRRSVDDAVETTALMCEAYEQAVSSWRTWGEWPAPLALPAWTYDGSKLGPGVWLPGENAVTAGWRAQKREQKRGRLLRTVHDWVLRPYLRRLERAHEAERQQRLEELGLVGARTGPQRALASEDTERSEAAKPPS